MSAPFVELHARSAFSFLEGASQPEMMVRQAAHLGYSSIAITDRKGFYGSARAHYEAKKMGIRAHVGCILESGDGSIPVLCASSKGYQLLSRHLTDLHLASGGNGNLPSNGDMIALTGDREGPVCRPLLRDDKAAALAAAERMVETFGQRNVYVEIFRHGLRDDGRLNRYLIDLASHLKLPLLASNAPLHAARGDRRLADAFACLKHHTVLDRAGRLVAANGERHLKTPQAMASLFSDLPHAVMNTLRLADRLEFTLENLGYRFPDFPDAYQNPLSMPEQTLLLRRLSYTGAYHRYGSHLSKEVRDQLEKELELIQRLGFPGYFLIVNDLMQYAKGEGILCQGRGSAANSIVCYCLGVTSVDPIAQKLLFERFLSEKRTTWPDIDIDFPSGDRREKVIQYVFEKYGQRNAAMTANVITYRGKSAFREMSKVLGFPPSIAEQFSGTPGRYKGEGSRNENAQDQYETEFDERVACIIPPSHPRLPALSHLYHAVLGMPRHLGQHSGGMVICDRGLDAVVPLQPATMAGRNVVQWDKDDCEDLGLVKIDLLGLGMLAAMEDMFEIISSRGKRLDMSTIPKDDPKVFEMMCRADTIGIFQIESRAQMATLPIMRPESFYDVVIEVAIIRPGPIVGDLVHPYLNRRKEKRRIGDGYEPDCMHESCREILGRTLGVTLFQEQILGISMKLAGFSGTEADDLRRAMAFKRNDERMREVSIKLRSRMTERGVEDQVQNKVIEAIGSFALYGFPESHAISFALLAYISSYLKVHYPAAFYTGLINAHPMGFYSVNTLIQDARRHGVICRPVSCLHSGVNTTVDEEGAIRLGLKRLKGVSRSTLDRLVAERNSAAFSSIQDLLLRVKPTAKEKRILAQAGALNELPQVDHRREALWQVELPLHEDLLDQNAPIRRGNLPAMNMPERLSADFRVTGASCGPHPMKLWREQNGSKRILRAKDLTNLPHGVPITVAGMAICRQRPGTAKGHCFVSLEDETGVSNLFIRKDLFLRLQRVITTEAFLLAEGRLQRSEGDQPTVYVLHVEPLTASNNDHAVESYDFH